MSPRTVGSSAEDPADQSPPRPENVIGASARRLSSDDDGSTYSADNEHEGQRGRLLPLSTLRYKSVSPAAAPSRSWRAKGIALWIANKGLLLVLVAQLFGALMNVTTRLLETSADHMNAFQVMFVRMGITLLLGSVYMWWAQVDQYPFGPKEVRSLLLARGFGGFFGLLGIYYSLQYLPLAEATVITFLAPIVACWACSVLLKEPFTRSEQVAALVSLLGVMLIARPTSFFSLADGEWPMGSGAGDGLPATNGTLPMHENNEIQVTAAQRLLAVGVALLGVFGAASAYTTIRWIGQRTHPLISVNYFAAWTTFVATVVLLFVPGMSFKLPAGLKQWSYLIFLGICGFAMQLLLTAGLAYEKSSRATNMVYSQMLFALAFDKLVFDTTPGTVSIVGSSLILGSALYVAVQQEPSKKSKRNAWADDEEVGLVAGGVDGESTIQDTRGPLRGVQEVQIRTLRV
ncbi:MAG: hypothetical protein LQ346_002583 [Caloplaca aetnensis]|nr:MAG: hypothetical protein LQ346_002583 [Caloplaca aetnensis]